MIDNTQLKNQIDEDISMIKNMLKTIQEESVYLTAKFILLSRYADLEKFLIDAYCQYLMGESSITGFKPEPKIIFKDKETFDKFHSKMYDHVDLKLINKVYMVSFEKTNGDNKIPFYSIYNTKNLEFKKLTSIRNLIAHRSESAQAEFEKECALGAPLDLDEYLFKYNGSFYNFYENMNLMKELSNMMVDL